MISSLTSNAQPPRRLWRFHGGLHLPDHKRASSECAIQVLPMPPLLVLPLHQHLGAELCPVVEAGSRVLKGQLLANSCYQPSAPLHAPTSGLVLGIEPRPVPHPSGLQALCVLLQPDGEDRWGERPCALDDDESLSPQDILDRIHRAGITGMGGASFPTHFKLAPAPDHQIHTLVINGAECEPFITCDDRLMRERSHSILRGALLLRQLLGQPQVLLGVEDNKPEAIHSLRAAARDLGHPPVEIISIPTLYPSGGERQLIRILTGHEVPSGGLPASIGVVCQNVATVAAVADAVLDGQPVISRLVTVTGQGVRRPGNFDVPLGTPIRHLLDVTESSVQPKRMLCGGPMMGYELRSDQVPVTKAFNCLLVTDATETPDPEPALACIRCGRCAAVCPARLLPQQLYWHIRARDWGATEHHHVFDCIECGCCAQVCPSHIPLVQYYRHAKQAIRNQEAERQQAEQARQRHEARQARLDRLENERKSKLRKKQEDIAADGTAATASAVAAAAQRAQAKRESRVTTAPAEGD